MSPALYHGEAYLWVCRDDSQRALVDSVRRRAGDDHVVWISDGSAYFYACRTRIPIGRYHGMGRADDRPEGMLAELHAVGASRVLACVLETARPMAQWEAIRTAGPGTVEELEPAADFRLFRMTSRP